jgi:hypothetical protein
MACMAYIPGTMTTFMHSPAAFLKKTKAHPGNPTSMYGERARERERERESARARERERGRERETRCESSARVYLRFRQGFDRKSLVRV